MSKRKKEVNKFDEDELKLQIDENEKQIRNIIEQSTEKNTQTYLYLFKTYDILEKILKITKFIEDKQPLIDYVSNSIAGISYYIYKKSSKKCLRMRYNGFRKAFLQ